MRIRPDFSQYVVHFTKDAPPFCQKQHPDPVKDILPLSAKDRLLGILNSKNIRATHMPWSDRPAVCFTECTWVSLFEHAKQYSRYGLGFKKKALFAKDGGPAIYLSPTLLDKQKDYVGKDKSPFTDELYSFVTIFAPDYMPTTTRAKHRRHKAVDYSHEREWRVPHDFSFELSDVAFVIVDTYVDMATAPKALKDTIGRENWLIMSNWERVEKLWPGHRT